MLNMLNMNTATRLAGRAKYLLNDNSVVILTGAAVAGVGATAFLTGKATFKAAELIADEHNRRNELADKALTPLSKTERVKLVWPQYIPPVALGATTIVCIISANRISSKKIAALVVASGVSERALTEYKEKVLEKLGTRQETAINDEIAQDRVTKNPPSGQVIIAGSGDVLCFEPLTGRYFNSTIEEVKAAENKINFEIIHFDFASLSTFFEEIGLSPTDYSDMVGWNVDNRPEIRFSTTMSENNKPCMVLDYVRIPSMDYAKRWA